MYVRVLIVRTRVCWLAKLFTGGVGAFAVVIVVVVVFVVAVVVVPVTVVVRVLALLLLYIWHTVRCSLFFLVLRP